MAEEIVNRVANSGLITIDLEDYYQQGDRTLFDIKEHLWQGLVLKEKDFRAFVKEHEWSKYQNQLVAIHCSADAIVPTWAYMLVASALSPFAQRIVFGNLEVLETILFNDALSTINPENFTDARVVIKGCGDLSIPASAFVELTQRIRPFARSIMYGEPCSTVPIYKKPRA